MASITPRELYARIELGQPVQLIDVRTPTEFAEVHASIARSVPLERLDPKALMAERPRATDELLYVICRSGSRGSSACKAFLAAGFTQAVNVEGGTLAWEQAGLPVVRGTQKKVMSLERQVRIAAGSFVVVGSALGFWVHPAWIGLSAFVGAGLVFSGLTDTCGMAMVLARMPWNQVANC